MKFKKLSTLLLAGALVFSSASSAFATDQNPPVENTVVFEEESASVFLEEADRQVNNLPSKLETFDEIRVTSNDNDGNLYLISDNVPADAVAYAQENLGNYYFSSAVVGYSTSEIESFKLGAPFMLQRSEHEDLERNIYYFPVISGNDIKAMLIVTKGDGNDYGYTFSLELIDALNELRPATSRQNPFYVFGTEKGFVAANADATEVYVLEVFSHVEEDHSVAANEIRALITEELEDDRSVHSVNAVVEVSAATAITSNFDDRETSAWMGKRLGLPGVTQDGYNHCWAASAASLCQYFRGSTSYPTRRDVVEYIKGSHINVGGSITDVKNAIDHFTSKSAYTTSPLAFTTVKSKILNRKPFYMATETKTGTRYGHGVAFDGYYRNDDYSGDYPPVRYFVMEPNRGYVVELSGTMGGSSPYASSSYITLNGMNFYWYATTAVS